MSKGALYPLNNIQSFLWHVHTDPTIKKILSRFQSWPVGRLSFTSLLLPAQTNTLPSENEISLHLWMTTTGPRSLWNAIKVSSSLIRGQIRDLASISRYNVARGKPCYLLAYGFKVWNFLYNLQQYDSFRWNEKRKPTSKK